MIARRRERAGPVIIGGLWPAILGAIVGGWVFAALGIWPGGGIIGSIIVA